MINTVSPIKIEIPENEIVFDFIRSTGPGGQNVNKVSSAVQLRFNIHNSSILTEDHKVRLVKKAGRKVNKNGVLIIKAQRFRTQQNNRMDALRRLESLILQTINKPKVRLKTSPSKKTIEKRLTSKRKRSATKQLRRSVDLSDQ